MNAPLGGKVAVVAGATRGAGRGIAAALGEAGATVVCTGRSSSRGDASIRSDYDRPETIEETAELVTRLGGMGVAIQVDHLVPEQVARLAERLRADSHYLLPLVVDRPGGLLVEITDGTASFNAERYRISVYYDLAKVAVNRLGFSQGHELAPFGAAAVAVTPGWLRSEMMLSTFGVTEEDWRAALDGSVAGYPAAPAGFAASESPRFVGRGIAALAADPDRARWNQRSVTAADLAREYGVTDIDGTLPDAWAQL